MALHKKPKGGQIVRTPAPDEDARVQNYGASSLVPGKGGPLTLLGANLRDSIDDPALEKVLSKGIAGRGDEIPADSEAGSLAANDLPTDGSLQRRLVPDKMYPPSHGMTRQQNPDAVFGNVTARPQRVARKLSANGMKALGRGAQPVRKP
jgi:hypothetical protein